MEVPKIQEIINNKIHCAIHMPKADFAAFQAIKPYTIFKDDFYEFRTNNDDDYCIYFKDGQSSGWDRTMHAIKHDIPIYECRQVMDLLWFDENPEKEYQIGDYVFDKKYSAYGHISRAVYYEGNWHYHIYFISPISDDWGDEIIGNVATADEIESVAFSTDTYSKLKKAKEDSKMVFEYKVTEDVRIDKTNNTRIPTMKTSVFISDCRSGIATCDKEDFDERTGILNAIANAVCGGNFDREYQKKLKKKKNAQKWLCTCCVCGKTYGTKEEADKCEYQHEENKKARRQRYLERKEAKERIAAAEREGRITKLMAEMLKDVQ